MNITQFITALFFSFFLTLSFAAYSQPKEEKDLKPGISELKTSAYCMSVQKFNSEYVVAKQLQVVGEENIEDSTFFRIIFSNKAGVAYAGVVDTHSGNICIFMSFDKLKWYRKNIPAKGLTVQQ